MIELENVSRIHHAHRPDQVVAVEEVSLNLDQGGVTILEGPSGSGKSSLLTLIGCMARPTSGRVKVDGRDVSRLPERALAEIRRQTFGFIFQQFHLVRGLSIEDNVQLPLVPLAMGSREMRERIEQVLEPLGLLKIRRRHVQKLSGGEQQRVAIARALVLDPQIIIADEPTAHLDSALSRELLELLAGLNRSGKTLIIASHDPLACEHVMVTRRITMRDGRIVAEARE